jgi:hypothetical protein
MMSEMDFKRKVVSSKKTENFMPGRQVVPQSLAVLFYINVELIPHVKMSFYLTSRFPCPDKKGTLDRYFK